MCARKYIHEKISFLVGWVFFLGVCVSSVIEKSLADSSKGGSSYKSIYDEIIVERLNFSNLHKLEVS